MDLQRKILLEREHKKCWFGLNVIKAIPIQSAVQRL